MVEEQSLQATEESNKAKYHANLAFWHIGQLDDLIMPTMSTVLLTIPLLATIRYSSPELFDTISKQAPKFWYGVGAFTAIGTFGQLAADFMVHSVQKVNTSLSLEEKLQTNGIFGIMRHRYMQQKLQL